MKKAKENWIGEQCSEIEENLRKNNSKREYQLVKDLTIVKQGKATIVQDLSGKCLKEERQVLNRWTEYCSELYNHKANGDQSVLNCPQTDTDSMITTFNTAVTETATEILGKHRQKEKTLDHCRNSRSVRQKERTEKEQI